MKYMLSMLGLFIILMGWMIQFLHTDKKSQFNPFFLMAYISGVSFLVIEGFTSGSYLTGSLNLLTLCVVMFIFMKRGA